MEDFLQFSTAGICNQGLTVSREKVPKSLPPWTLWSDKVK